MIQTDAVILFAQVLTRTNPDPWCTLQILTAEFFWAGSPASSTSKVAGQESMLANATEWKRSMSANQSKSIDSASYRIPVTGVQGAGVIPYCFAISLIFVALSVAVHRMAEKSWLESIGVSFWVGVISLLISAFVIGIPYSIRVSNRARRVWSDHSYTWYRQTFPNNVTARGEVTCRHCGSHRTNVRNMMERTYMRCHSCSQCGETLYFSPEKT